MDKNEELKQQVLNEENKKDDGLNDKQREAVYMEQTLLSVQVLGLERPMY